MYYSTPLDGNLNISEETILTIKNPNRKSSCDAEEVLATFLKDNGETIDVRLVADDEAYTIRKEKIISGTSPKQ